MDRLHWLLLPLALAAMWCAFVCANRPLVLQEPVPVVQPDWVSEARREAQRQAIVNPWEGYKPQFPGANK